MDNEELLLTLNSKLDDISKQLSDLSEGIAETREIASVFKEFGSMMGAGKVHNDNGVPLLSP